MRVHGRLWSMLLLALVSAAATAATIAAGTGDDASSRPPVATAPTPTAPTTTDSKPDVSAPATTTAPPATTTAAATSPRQPTITTGTLPKAPGAPSTPTTTAPPPAAPAPERAGVRSWPSGRSGYTTILLSLPQSAGRDAALARARRALAAGLPQVGVLDSSAYASLRSGYWVVFSGIYGTSGRAQAAAAGAHARGFPGAYPARIAP